MGWALDQQRSSSEIRWCVASRSQYISAQELSGIWTGGGLLAGLVAMLSEEVLVQPSAARMERSWHVEGIVRVPSLIKVTQKIHEHRTPWHELIVRSPSWKLIGSQGIGWVCFPSTVPACHASPSFWAGLWCCLAGNMLHSQDLGWWEQGKLTERREITTLSLKPD